MIKAIIHHIFKEEFKQLEAKKLLMDLEISNAQQAVEKIRSSYDERDDIYFKQLQSHEKDLKTLQKTIELQKIYCYLIPRLINSSGIDLPDGFDISNYDDASELRKRFMDGDLKSF